MRRCVDEKMCRWEDVKMRRWDVMRCGDVKMWRWDEKMRRCEDVKVREKIWIWEDEKMWRWEGEMRRWEDEMWWDVKMWRCEDEMRRWEDVRMRECEDEMRRYEYEKMRRCEDEKVRRCEDEKMRCDEMWRCEDEMRRWKDEKMWKCEMRWEDEKMRRCEDVKMWDEMRRWEDEKMRRCEDVRMRGERLRKCEDEKMRRCDDRPPLLEEPFAQTLSRTKLLPATRESWAMIPTASRCTKDMVTMNNGKLRTWTWTTTLRKHTAVRGITTEGAPPAMKSKNPRKWADPPDKKALARTGLKWPARRYTPPPATSRGLFLKPWSNVFLDFRRSHWRNQAPAAFTPSNDASRRWKCSFQKGASWIQSISQSTKSLVNFWMLLLQVRPKLSRSRRNVKPLQNASPQACHRSFTPDWPNYKTISKYLRSLVKELP